MTLFAPSPAPYALKCCCLWLEEEVALRLAWAVKEGVGLALGKGAIPRKYFDALCDTPAEAGRREFTTNRARREAAAGFKG